MNMPFVDGQMVGWMIVRVSVLLAAAAMAHALLGRRSSAAARHLVLTFTVAGLLVLPVLSAALPRWNVAIPVPAANPRVGQRAEPEGLTAPVTRDVDASSIALATIPASTPNARAAINVSWAAALSGVYAVGMLLLLIQLAWQRLTVERIARRATPVSDPAWQRLLLECARSIGLRRPVRLLCSRERTMPMAVGTRRPAILIPAVADMWSEDRRRAVLLHELAHVARHDCATQMLAAMVCALYWIHPGVWWVARRLRVERELACDDRVLTVGTHARDYAGHLLELAYTLGGRRAPALAVSMARPRQLEGRMLAVLDAARNRTTPGVRSRLAGVAVMVMLLLPIAGLEARLVPAVPDGITLDTASRDAAPASGQSAAQPNAVAQEPLPGTWEIRPSKTPGSVYLRLAEGSSSHGSSWPVERFEGLAAGQLTGAGGPVRFTSRRDAGTFTFEGILRNGVGAGMYTFTPSATFPAELSKRGFGRVTSADQYKLALGDIGFAFLDELAKQGYGKADVSQLVRAAEHGARLDYLREMGGLGYRLGSLDALIEQRDHGVSPEFIRGLADQGLKGLKADELLRARDHGLSPEYIRELRELGYSVSRLDQLITLRDHGLSPEYIRELGKLGYSALSLEALVAARDHGISPEYVRDLRDLGYRFGLAELTNARDHGVGPEFVRELTALGYRNLPLESLIRLRDHGVTPKYVQELKDLGYDRIELDELVALRDHGVTPERIRGLNARAGTRLPLDMLKAAAAGGWR